MQSLTVRTAYHHPPNKSLTPLQQRPAATVPMIVPGIPFNTVEEAWFWFICAMEAREDGATPGKSRGEILRPCEPTDIYRTLERLYRKRRLRNSSAREKLQQTLARSDEGIGCRAATAWHRARYFRT